MMTDKLAVLKGKYVLAVDDEKDILDTIEDILDGVKLEKAGDYASASEKIKANRYDFVILDIMGVDGLTLLDEAVERNIPAIMLTAHAINPEALMESIRKGAISYLPKETLSELDELLAELISTHENGEPPWKHLFEKLGDYYDERFGKGWKDKNKDFWTEFEKSYTISRGIQKRLLKNPNVIDKGI
jgi:CheY-like chemotaxis protein